MNIVLRFGVCVGGEGVGENAQACTLSKEVSFFPESNLPRLHPKLKAQITVWHPAFLVIWFVGFFFYCMLMALGLTMATQLCPGQVLSLTLLPWFYWPTFTSFKSSLCIRVVKWTCILRGPSNLTWGKDMLQFVVYGIFLLFGFGAFDDRVKKISML